MPSTPMPAPLQSGDDTVFPHTSGVVYPRIGEASNPPMPGGNVHPTSSFSNPFLMFSTQNNHPNGSHHSGLPRTEKSTHLLDGLPNRDCMLPQYAKDNGRGLPHTHHNPAGSFPVPGVDKHTASISSLQNTNPNNTQKDGLRFPARTSSNGAHSRKVTEGRGGDGHNTRFAHLLSQNGGGHPVNNNNNSHHHYQPHNSWGLLDNTRRSNHNTNTTTANGEERQYWRVGDEDESATGSKLHTGLQGESHLLPQTQSSNVYHHNTGLLLNEQEFGGSPAAAGANTRTTTNNVHSMSLSTLAVLQQQLQQQQQQQQQGKPGDPNGQQPMYVLLTPDLLQHLLHQQNGSASPPFGFPEERWNPPNPSHYPEGGNGMAFSGSVLPLSSLYNPSSIPHQHSQQTAAWINGNNGGLAYQENPGNTSPPMNYQLHSDARSLLSEPNKLGMWEREAAGANNNNNNGIWSPSQHKDNSAKSLLPPPGGYHNGVNRRSPQVQQPQHGGGSEPNPAANRLMSEKGNRAAFFSPSPQQSHSPQPPAAPGLMNGMPPPAPRFPHDGEGHYFILNNESAPDQLPPQPSGLSPDAAAVLASAAPHNRNLLVQGPPPPFTGPSLGPRVNRRNPSPGQGALKGMGAGTAPASPPPTAPNVNAAGLSEDPPPGSCANGSHFTVAAWYEGKIKRYNPQRGFGFITGLFQLLLDGAQCEEICTQYLPLPSSSAGGSSRQQRAGDSQSTENKFSQEGGANAGGEDDSGSSNNPQGQSRGSRRSDPVQYPTAALSTIRSSTTSPSLREVCGMPIEMQLPPKGTLVEGGVVVLSTMQWYLRLAEQEQQTRSATRAVASSSSIGSSSASGGPRRLAAASADEREKMEGTTSDGSENSAPLGGLLKLVKKPMPHLGDIFVHHSCISLEGLGVLTPYTVVRFSVAVVMNTVQAVDVVPIGPSWRTWQNLLIDDRRMRSGAGLPMPSIPRGLYANLGTPINEKGTSTGDASSNPSNREGGLTGTDPEGCGMTSSSSLNSLMPSCRISGHALLAMEQHRLQSDAESKSGRLSSHNGSTEKGGSSGTTVVSTNDTDDKTDAGSGSQVQGSGSNHRHRSSSALTWKDVVVIPSAAIPNAIEGRSELRIVERRGGEQLGIYTLEKLLEEYHRLHPSLKSARRVAATTAAVTQLKGHSQNTNSCGEKDSEDSSSKEQDTSRTPLTHSSQRADPGLQTPSADTDGSSRNPGGKRSDDSQPTASEEAPSGSEDQHKTSPTADRGPTTNSKNNNDSHTDNGEMETGQKLKNANSTRPNANPSNESTTQLRSGASKPTQLVKDEMVPHPHSTTPQLSTHSSQVMVDSLTHMHASSADGQQGKEHQPQAQQQQQVRIGRSASMARRLQGGREYSILSSPHQAAHSVEYNRPLNQGSEDYEEQCTSTTTASDSTLPESKVNNPAVNSDWTEMFNKKISQEKIKDALLYKTNMMYFPRNSPPPVHTAVEAAGGKLEGLEKGNAVVSTANNPTAHGIAGKKAAEVGDGQGFTPQSRVYHQETKTQPAAAAGVAAAGVGSAGGMHHHHQSRLPSKPIERNSPTDSSREGQEEADQGPQPRSTSTESPNNSGKEKGSSEEDNAAPHQKPKPHAADEGHESMEVDGVAPDTIKDLELVEVRHLPHGLRQQVPHGVFIIALPSAVVRSLHVPTLPLARHRVGKSFSALNHHAGFHRQQSENYHQNSSDSSDTTANLTAKQQQRPPRAGLSATMHSTCPLPNTVGSETHRTPRSPSHPSHHPPNSSTLRTECPTRLQVNNHDVEAEEQSQQSSSFQDQQHLHFVFDSCSSRHSHDMGHHRVCTAVPPRPNSPSVGEESDISDNGPLPLPSLSLEQPLHRTVPACVGLNITDTTTATSSQDGLGDVYSGAESAMNNSCHSSTKIQLPQPPWLKRPQRKEKETASGGRNATEEEKKARKEMKEGF